MSNELISFNSYEWHKGFYCEKDPNKALSNIDYLDYFKERQDELCDFMSAEQLLSGACEHFAVMLNKIFNYNVYIIEEKNGKGFHAFCQIYKNRRWHYIDARGITTSFNEFMKIAGTFVNDEFIIRKATSEDIKQWEDYEYNKEVYDFVNAVIQEYKSYYTLD